jgi:selenoprotein W-related protein
VAELLEAHQHDIAEVRIIPSSGGVFEVEVDGTALYSQTATGRHAEPGEVLAALAAHLAQGS